MISQPAGTDVSKKTIRLPEYFKHGYLLVVDDMANMRKTVKNMLRQLGVNEIVEAGDGDEALQILKARGEGCKFVLLDWNMPRMPGVNVAREIRATSEIQDLPILMITAEANMEQITSAGEIGVNGYILKPFVAKTLEEKIRRILELRENPPKHVQLIKAGEALMKGGDHENAIKLFKEAQKLMESARINVHLGEAYGLKGEFARAQESFDKAVQINPQYLKAHIATAELQLKQGNEEAALEAMEKASAISPSNTERGKLMGTMYLAKGNEEAAQKAFQRVIKADPKMGADVAEEYLKAGKAEMAEQYFRGTLKLQANNVNIYNRLGIALRKQGKWAAAIEEYKKALAVAPDDEVLYYNMGKAYLEGNLAAEARSAFTRAAQLRPDFKEALAELKAI